MTRNQEMVELYITKALSLEKIGNKYGITRERVRQILHSQLLPYQYQELKRETFIKRSEVSKDNRSINKCKQCGNKTDNKGFCSTKCFADFRRLPIEEKRRRHAIQMKRYFDKYPEKRKELYIKRRDKIRKAFEIMHRLENEQKT